LPSAFNTLQLPPCRISVFVGYSGRSKRISMSTEAQIAANRRNAEASTGPRTAEGKARVSHNATAFGLYSAGDVVRPGEESLYQAFCEDFQTELAPQGAMETTLAAEIIHAAWRLRRCAAAESALEAQSDLDPMLDPATTAAQNSIDRARAQALRHLHRATAELRRLQKERRIPATPPSEQQRPRLLKPVATKQTQSEPPRTVSIPRGAPCPCGSGAKYKRCCGTNAPAVLSPAA
jgi:SEC-C motif